MDERTVLKKYYYIVYKNIFWTAPYRRFRRNVKIIIFDFDSRRPKTLTADAVAVWDDGEEHDVVLRKRMVWNRCDGR